MKKNNRLLGLAIVLIAVFGILLPIYWAGTPETNHVNGSDDGIKFEHIRWFKLRDTILDTGLEIYCFNGFEDDYYGATLIISLRHRTDYYGAVEYLYVSLDNRYDITFDLAGTQYTIISYNDENTRVKIGWS